MWSGLVWLRQRQAAGCCEHGDGLSGCITCGVCWLAEELSACEVGDCSGPQVMWVSGLGGWPTVTKANSACSSVSWQCWNCHGSDGFVLHWPLRPCAQHRMFAEAARVSGLAVYRVQALGISVLKLKVNAPLACVRPSVRPSVVLRP
jgi:hypothetical protein